MTVAESLLQPPVVAITYLQCTTLCYSCIHQALERGKAGAPLPSPNPDDSDPTSLMGTDLGEHHGWEVSGPEDSISCLYFPLSPAGEAKQLVVHVCVTHRHETAVGRPLVTP